VPAIHQPIPDPDAALRIAREAVQGPWNITAEVRRITLDRLGEIMRTGKPLQAIQCAWILLAMERSNRASAELLMKLDTFCGPFDARELQALERWLDAPEQPGLRSVAS
jgi:hypothetical protein